MIERYSLSEMRRIWSDAERLKLWLDVELALAETYERHGTAPAGSSARIRQRAVIDPDRMQAIEAEVRHDVIAFLSMIAESIGDDARYLHVGMTSSDLVDTALACQIAEAGGLLSRKLKRLRQVAWELAQRHRHTPMVGRTHGIHAEPITFGLKCLVWCEELGRDQRRWERAVDDTRVGKLSGAVGTLAHLDPLLEHQALERLGLEPEPIANQVVQRDRHAALMCTLGVIAGTLEKIALEIRHLQRTEVGEAEEPFAAGQKGSSAMPHKRNPVRCERIGGLARLIRGYLQAALENQALWHERDISHSSAERVILPDAFLVADFMITELAEILENLSIHEGTMLRHLQQGGGVIFSQPVLLALTERGMARDQAYRLIQQHAMSALNGGPEFRAALMSDPRVTAVLDPESLSECFSLDRSLRNVDALFARAQSPEP